MDSYIDTIGDFVIGWGGNPADFWIVLGLNLSVVLDAIDKGPSFDHSMLAIQESYVAHVCEVVGVGVQRVLQLAILFLGSKTQVERVDDDFFVFCISQFLRDTVE